MEVVYHPRSTSIYTALKEERLILSLVPLVVLVSAPEMIQLPLRSVMSLIISLVSRFPWSENRTLP